ncbi:tetratricopeptide repeat protein [Luteitalea sp.]|jgi:tetratricopeptide (TPR) repeat protein|uniref:carboxypeptidase-like regulatory domain-containing protein n=1 Tax=Luteitalea sp. TaxID=2004800 RepID=UPI0037CBE9F1
MSALRFGARLVAAATLAIAFVVAALPAAAQTTGAIRGKVVDGKGQPVDKATVTIEFKGGTVQVREVKTNKRGEFTQVGLQPGPYYLVVKADAGQAADQIQVPVGNAQEMNFTLKPAAKGMSAEESAFRKTFDEGVTAMGAKNHDEAITKFNDAIKMQADCYACYMNVGSAHYEKKELDKAEAAFKKAAELKPDDPKPVSVLADLYNSQGKREEAAAMASKAAALGAAGGGGSAQDSYNQGVILWNAGKIAEAKTQFEAAVKADPNYADANYWVGMANLNGGNMSEAVKYFENYLKLAPTGPMAAQAKGIVDQIKPKE